MTRYIDEKGYDNLGRPCKDLYYMNLCYNVNIRSFDPSTKCGSVAVDSFGGILTTGYNAPVRNSIDENIPLTRPEKYVFFEHSERNLIYTAARKGISLDGSTMYVTGLPCLDCLRGILQVGCVRCVYGPLQAVMGRDSEYVKHYKRMMDGQTMRLEQFKYVDSLLALNPSVKDHIADRPDFALEFNV